jgi:hypothetical protein
MERFQEAFQRVMTSGSVASVVSELRTTPPELARLNLDGVVIPTSRA